MIQVFFIGQSFFHNNGSQRSLIFQPTIKTITILSDFLDEISEWESRGLSNEKVKPPFTADKSRSPKLAWINESRIRLRFKGSCLKQEFLTFTSKNVVKFISCV